jgi:hypothetical protein
MEGREFPSNGVLVGVTYQTLICTIHHPGVKFDVLFEHSDCRRAPTRYSSHIDLSVFLRDIVSLALKGHNSCAFSKDNLIATFQGCIASMTYDVI